MEKTYSYEVVYSTESFTDGFEVVSVEDGKEAALDLLIEWESQDRDWWGSRMPNEDEIDDWDSMIENCEAYVVQYDNDKVDEYGCGEYEIVWQPDDEDLKRIWWLYWDEIAESYKSLMDTINAKGDTK